MGLNYSFEEIIKQIQYIKIDKKQAGKVQLKHNTIRLYLYTKSIVTRIQINVMVDYFISIGKKQNLV